MRPGRVGDPDERDDSANERYRERDAIEHRGGGLWCYLGRATRRHATRCRGQRTRLSRSCRAQLAERERRVKVLDFGLAKLREEAAADGETTTAALSGERRILE